MRQSKSESPGNSKRKIQHFVSHPIHNRHLWKWGLEICALFQASLSSPILYHIICWKNEAESCFISAKLLLNTQTDAKDFSFDEQRQV